LPRSGGVGRGRPRIRLSAGRAPDQTGDGARGAPPRRGAARRLRSRAGAVMKKLALSDVKNLYEYELIRDDWRKSVIEEKARRRVLLGPKISVVFENRLTVLAQIQEMCRIERIAQPEKVQEEIDVYNALL